MERRVLFVYLCLGVLGGVLSRVTQEQELYAPHIASLLYYLNNQPEQTHAFSFETLLHAETEDNGFTKIVLDVKGVCDAAVSVSPCSPAVFTCRGIVQNVDDNYQTLPGIICQPKETGTTEKVEISSTVEPEKIPVHEEPVAVQRVPEYCLGCPVDLDPNVQGIDGLVYTALRHVESERTRRHLATNVLRVQQQIVAGVKYILLVEISPTVCAKDVDKLTSCPTDSRLPAEVCEITFYQRPWISKTKDIVGNNCTVTQRFGETQENRDDNDVYVVDKERSVDLGDLESQIIPNSVLKDTKIEIRPLKSGTLVPDDLYYQGDQPHESHNRKKSRDCGRKKRDSSDSSGDSDECGKKHKKKESDSDDSDDSKRHKCGSSDSSDSDSDDCKHKHDKCNSSDDSSDSDDCKHKHKECNSSDDSSSSSDSSDNCKCKHKKAKKHGCDSSSSSSSEECEKSHKKSRRKRNVPELDGDDPELIRNLAGIALNFLNETDSSTLVSQVLDAKKEHMTNGVKYRLILKVTTNDDSMKICKVSVLINADSDSPKLLKSRCAARNKRETRKRPRLGGLQPYPDDAPEVRDFVENALKYYDSQLGGKNKVTVLHIFDVSRQLVSGYLYRIKVEVAPSNCQTNSEVARQNCKQVRGSEPFTCSIKVWDEPWKKNGRETNITCSANPQKFSFRSKRETARFQPDNAEISLESFQNFVSAYGKSYENHTEFKMRFRIFRKNMKKVHLLNKYEQGTAKYGATRFADLTEFEFKSFLGYKRELRNENEINLVDAKIPDIEVSADFDWRSKGVVSPVKNQGGCGSCWAFSVTGNVEGQYAIKYGNLLEFSEQELVDCDSTDAGCGGGEMTNAYRAIEKLGGLETEQDYPYEGDDEKCHFNKTLAKVRLAGALNISSDEADMAKWLAKNGPISIAINANAMQFYFGGVSHPWKALCNPKSLDHGVLIVGYGVQSKSTEYPYLNKTLPYWIVKNSWGKSWGQQGYYMVYRGDETCGVNQEPTSAIVA